MNLTDVKLHLRVDDDDNAEDSLIQSMLDAATAAALDYLNLANMPDPAPAPIEAAILLAVGDLYANRERQSDAQLYANLTYERLLAPYRVMEI
ncbi:MAG: head-tail connector protein [Castellaniella sp.]